MHGTKSHATHMKGNGTLNLGVQKNLATVGMTPSMMNMQGVFGCTVPV